MYYYHARNFFLFRSHFKILLGQLRILIILQLRRQLNVRVLLLEPVLGELVFKEEERVAVAVLNQHVARGGHLRVELVGVDPAGGLLAERFHDHFRVVLVLHPELENLKLQLAHRPEDVVVGGVALVELHRPFLDQLVDPLVEGLLLHHVLGRNADEEFRSKLRQLFKLNRLLAGEDRIPDLEITGIVETNDVAGHGGFHVLPGVGHELGHVRQPQRLAGPFEGHIHSAVKFPGADPHEGDPVAMLGVHVGLNLENEAGEFRGQRVHRLAVVLLVRARRRGKLEVGF